MRTILLSAALVGCVGKVSQPAPDYVTEVGLEVYVHEGANDYGAEALDIAAVMTAGHFGEYAGDLAGTPVRFTADNTCGCSLAAGCTAYNALGVWRVDIWAEPECLADTAFQHELIHVWDELAGREPDYHHKHPKWERLPAVVYRLRSYLCPVRPGVGDGRDPL